MSADDLLNLLTQGIFVLIFVGTATKALQRRTRANLDIALLFGAFALIIFISRITTALGIDSNPQLGALASSLLMTIPFLTLRLVEDFAGVPLWLLRVGHLGLIASVVTLFLLPPPVPGMVAVLMVAYFAGLELYAAGAFVRQTQATNGLTRRRMQAVALGSVFLGLLLLVALGQFFAPGLNDLWSVVSHILGLLCGISYAIGFSPPLILRRAWQEPELRAFLGKAAELPRFPDTPSIVRALQRGAANSVGAPWATILLWDEFTQRLYLPSPELPPRLEVATRVAATVQPLERSRQTGDGRTIAGRVFAEQFPIFTDDAARDDPDHAEGYRAYQARAIMAAPITAGEQRLGVLTVYAPRAPIFAEDDLALVQLLARQAAVILESRALIDEAAQVRAREEATRLKDDFLSAAAHDLKTPLTTLVAQTQLMELRAARTPQAPPDLGGIQRLVAESGRLKQLVLELLDASRVEQGQLVEVRETVDLTELVREICDRHTTERYQCLLDAQPGIFGELDRIRVGQVVENLVENAVKYTPQGGRVCVRLWSEGGEAHLNVQDEGIGIPPDELGHIFDRYQRGRYVDDRRFAGMGLGLYICHGIVTQHGGRIWATSDGPGRGSTFHVVLPISSGVLVS